MGNQRSTFCDNTYAVQNMLLDQVSNDILDNSGATIQEIVERTKQPLDYCTALQNCLDKARANELYFRRAIQQIEQFKEEHPEQFEEKSKNENKLDITYTLLMLFFFPFTLLVLLLHLGRKGLVIISMILCLFMDPSKVLSYLLLLLLLILLIMTIIAITLLIRILLSSYDNKNRSSRNYKGLEALNQFRACGNPFGTAAIELTRMGTAVLTTQKHLLEKARQVHSNMRREGNWSNTAGTVTLIAAMIYRALNIALGHTIPIPITTPYSFDKSMKSYQSDWRRQEELLSNVESIISCTVDELNNINRSFTVLSCRYWSWCKSKIDAAAGEENRVTELMMGIEEVFEELKDLLQRVENFRQEYIEARAEILKMIIIN